MVHKSCIKCDYYDRRLVIWPISASEIFGHYNRLLVQWETGFMHICQFTLTWPAS